jgi:hypothetical protein
MNFSLVYLVQRFFYRLFDFFHHWYVDGSRWFGRKFIGTLTDLDKTFALRVTVEHFFEPLFGDYTIIGRIMGAIFRTFRVLVGVIVYVVVAIIAAVFYLAWLAIPAVVVLKIIRG